MSLGIVGSTLINYSSIQQIGEKSIIEMSNFIVLAVESIIRKTNAVKVMHKMLRYDNVFHFTSLNNLWNNILKIKNLAIGFSWIKLENSINIFLLLPYSARVTLL